jgi:hypothetical protein
MVALKLLKSEKNLPNTDSEQISLLSNEAKKARITLESLFN